MELKVWVDGIQRVICGVSDSTTCQDIVLALAHATGRTGRFTLIEKWRSNERPLAPDEQPLQVLHKWGEYATDVQFMLIQTDRDGLKSPSRTRLPSHDKKDRFTHNFTPPHHGDSSIKRSFTFSGAHSGNSFTSPARKREKFREVFHENSISEESELGSSSHVSHPSPSTSHSAKPTAASRSPNHKLPGAPSSNLRRESPASDRNSGQKSPHRSTTVNSDATGNSQVARSNGRPIPKPRSRSSSSTTNNGPKSLDTYLSQNSPPDFQEAWSSSPLPEFEEYDLDRNFPDASPQKQDAKSRGTPASKADSVSSSDESQEYSSLMKLVSQQQDRLQVQESEISKIETEIKQLEEKGRAEEERLRELEAEILSWEGRTGVCEQELEDLVSQRWPDQLEAQVQAEHRLKAETDALRTKITNCQQQIVEMVRKRESIIEDIEREKKDILDREKKGAEVELRVKQEVTDVQKKINEKQTEIEKGHVTLEELTKEVKDLDAAILEKKLQVAELESSLKEANLQQFVITPPETPNHLEEGESALFKQLHRPPATRKPSPQDFSSTVTTSEHPDGVWV